MSYDLTAAAAILKERYPKDKVTPLGWRKNPLFALLKKDLGAGGDQDKIPVEVTGEVAASATFSVCQTVAAATSADEEAFECTTINAYSLARITGKAWKACRNKDTSFVVDAADRRVKSAMATSVRRTNIHLYGDSTGEIGVVGSESTTSLTLKDIKTVHRFEVGMYLVFAASAAAALRDSGDKIQITAINRTTGVLTAATNWTTTITGLAADDVIFAYGDYVSTSDRLCVSGFEAWIPETAPTGGDSFFGVDRSSDVWRLAGVRYDADAAGDTIEEALLNGASEGGMNGAAPTLCFLNPVRCRELVNSISSNVVYEKVQARGLGDEILADIGFDAIVIRTTNGGKLRVVEDVDCPYDVAWLIDPETWTLISMGGFPGVLDEDGQTFRAIYNADGYEVRVGGYFQLTCTNPGANVRIKLS